jgi:hypothetical protein
VDESGMIGIQIGKHDRLEMVAVQASPCAPPPRVTVTVYRVELNLT